MMKVVFFRHSLLSRGGDKMILAHAGYLAKQGWSVEIQTAHVDTVFPLPPEIQIVDLGSRSKAATLWKALNRRFDADVVIADIIPLICLLALRNRRRLVYFAQDYDETYYGSTIPRLFIRMFYFLGLRLLRIRTITVADHLSQLLRRRFEAHVVTVENGVDTDVFFPDPDKEILENKGGRKAVVLLSRSDARKGFDLGCRIYSEVCKRLGAENLEVWTVGEPAWGVFKGNPHRDFGYVAPERLRRILSSADAFIYHTRHEGFPLMALEALACGCPMAASAAVPVLKPDHDALIAPVGDIDLAADQVVRILTRPEVAEQLRKEGLAFARRHSMQQSSACFSEALSSFC